MLMVALVEGALLLLLISLEIGYFLRGAMAVIQAVFQPREMDILSMQSFKSVVLPRDLDQMWHMNNSRYLRECDFARLHFYTRNRLLLALFKVGGRMVVGASTIRYRRSLAVWEFFEIQTKILAWDEKAFYMEQRFVSKKDGFVSAVMFCKQNLLNCSPEKLIGLVWQRQIESPELPEDVKHWISFLSANSQTLRAETERGSESHE